MPNPSSSGQTTVKPCVACGGQVSVIESLKTSTPCVVSDCRPWMAGRMVGQCQQCGLTQRATTGDHEVETGEMYADYEMYSHSSGTGDQKSFLDGAGRGRTAHILDFLRTHTSAPNTAILDVGSGSGSGLAAIAAAFPNVPLDGLEPFDDPSSRAGSNIDSLRTVHRNWESVGGAYDLITMFHVFEHVPDPLPALERIKSHLTDDGTLLIQVPYFPDNPFDLLVADHISHYRCIDIDRLLRQAGFRPLEIRTDVIRKEITAIATTAKLSADNGAGDAKRVGPDDETAKSLVSAQLEWLMDVQQHIKSSLQEAGGSLGVYGTGPVGAWISAIIGEKVAFYIDDDKDRQGSVFLDKKIYAYKNAPYGTPIYLGFLPEVAQAIQVKHGISDRIAFMPPER